MRDQLVVNPPDVDAWLDAETRPNRCNPAGGLLSRPDPGNVRVIVEAERVKVADRNAKGLAKRLEVLVITRCSVIGTHDAHRTGNARIASGIVLKTPRRSPVTSTA